MGDGNNNEGCEYDGGDCCAKSAENGQVKTKWCKECKCVDPKNQDEGEAAPTCEAINYKGDGNCDDGNNNEGCEYDGGDCCENTVMKDGQKTGKVKTKWCKECKCLDPQ